MIATLSILSMEHGSQTPLNKMKRFWNKVNIQGLNKCWLWTASQHRNGYGRFRYNGKIQSTHRVAWELTNGFIPEDLQVCHNCPSGDNKLCVNPNHLFLATHAEHGKDMQAKKQMTDKKGGLNGRAKLNDWKVCGIMARYLQGISQSQVAKEFNISEITIARICAKKSWAHLFNPL